VPVGITIGADGIARCAWARAHADYRAYHDREWGFAVGDDVQLFEKLSLEGFQAGLSWLTILRKRENFRRAFDGFDFRVVAGYTADDVARLLIDAGIVRHRGKIEAVIHNAGRATELVAGEGSLAAYLWSFAPPRRTRPIDHAALATRATCPEAIALAKDLKRRGWRFVGPTTAYALMQSMGLVDDHLDGCEIYPRAEAARSAFSIPSAPTPSPPASGLTVRATRAAARRART
jgi:DNA-3-methyladenine glycosylase I